MEPCFIKHGNLSQVGCVVPGWRIGFNGAMLYQAWKHPDMSLPDAEDVSLQWSHALSSMETLSSVADLSRRESASMEPCFIKHGNHYDDRTRA